jgi:hypothetical protein
MARPASQPETVRLWLLQDMTWAPISSLRF